MKKYILFVFILLISVSCSRVDSTNDEIIDTIKGDLVKIDSVDGYDILYTKVHYHDNRIVYDKNDKFSLNLNNNATIKVIDTIEELTYKTLSREEFLSAITKGQYANATFTIRYMDTKGIIEIEENVSRLKANVLEDKAELLEEHAKRYIYKKIWELNNNDIYSHGDKYDFTVSGFDLIRPKKIEVFSDILSDARFELWSLDYRLTIKGNVQKELVEFFGIEDGVITKPYSLGKAYLMVEQKGEQAKVLGISFVEQEEEISREKFINFLKATKRIKEDTFDIALAKKVEVSGEIQESVDKVVIDAAKEEVAKIVFDINMMSNANSTKIIEGDIIKEAKITAINDKGLAHVANSSGESLYSVEYKLKSQDDGVVSQFFNISKKDGYITAVKEHPTPYLVHVWNSEQNYIAYTTNQREIDNRLKEIKDTTDENEKYSRILTTLVKENEY